jgi:hypothetical protein
MILVSRGFEAVNTQRGTVPHVQNPRGQMYGVYSLLTRTWSNVRKMAWQKLHASQRTVSDLAKGLAENSISEV